MLTEDVKCELLIHTHTHTQKQKHLQLCVQHGRELHIKLPVEHKANGTQRKVRLAVCYLTHDARPSAIGLQLPPVVSEEHIQAGGKYSHIYSYQRTLTSNLILNSPSMSLKS